MSPARTIPVDALRLALFVRVRSLRPRPVAYTTHPYTGSDCRNPHGWKAHGGPLFSPWCPGHIDHVVDRVNSHGRQEVLRTFGLGIRALRTEVRTGAAKG